MFIKNSSTMQPVTKSTIQTTLLFGNQLGRGSACATSTLKSGSTVISQEAVLIDLRIQSSSPVPLWMVQSLFLPLFAATTAELEMGVYGHQ